MIYRIGAKIGMMMMVAKAFIDTNIILRSIHQAMPHHTDTRQLVEQHRNNGYELWISRQVIREYLVQVTRTGVLAVPLTMQQAGQRVDDIAQLYHIADDTHDVTQMLKLLMQQFPTVGKQVHDANIVATMLVYGIDTLLTLNIADIQRFSSKINLVTI